MLEVTLHVGTTRDAPAPGDKAQGAAFCVACAREEQADLVLVVLHVDACLKMLKA